MLTKCVECGAFYFKTAKDAACLDCQHEAKVFAGYAKLNRGEREALARAMLDAGALSTP